MEKLDISENYQVHLFLEDEQCYLEFENHIYPIELNSTNSITASSAKELIKQGHEVYVITYPHKNIKDIDGIHVIGTKGINIPGLRGLLFSINARKALDKLTNEKEIDIIHGHYLFPAGFAATQVGKKHGITTYVTAHGSDMFELYAKQFYIRPIIKKVLKNAAFPAYTDIHPLSWAFLSLPEPPARNPAQAMELLTAAGWKSGADGIMTREGRRLSFTLAVPSGDKSREEVAEFISRQLSEIGVQMRVQRVEAKTFFGDILPNRRFETVLFAWVNNTEPDNYDLWHSRRIPSPANRGAGKNYAGWRSTEVDSLLENLRRTAEIGTRRESLLRIQEILIAEAPVIPLYYRADIAAAKRNIANYKPNPFSGNFWNVWEWGLR